jgi:WD40 repeat protein
MMKPYVTIMFTLLSCINAVSDSYAQDEPVTVNGRKNSVYCLEFSPDGKTLAVHGLGPRIDFYDPATGKNTGAIDTPDGLVYAVAFRPDGRSLASVGFEQERIRLWDIPGGQASATLDAERPGHNLTFSPDGKWLASSSMSTSSVRVWSLAGKSYVTLQCHDEPWALSFAPGGKTLAVGCEDGDIVLWDWASKKETRRLKGHDMAPNAIAFLPDGKTLLSAGGGDQTIRRWDVETGKSSVASIKQPAQFLSMAFSPDRKTVASGDKDGGVKLWDAQTGASVAVLKGHEKSVRVAFNPDGKTLASGGDDKTIKIWKIEKYVGK